MKFLQLSLTELSIFKDILKALLRSGCPFYV